ncbi:MAG TPA: polysaccharide deacetylase family protein [Saliniramus sp.]|nr:polysaccharide deacetylase family protein [Saliniramus sp.]
MSGLGIRTRARRALARVVGGRFVLVYHRVARPRHDPWGLCVSPERFAGQVAALAAYGPIFTVSELARRVSDGTAPRRASAISFDDGYADNLHVAAPLLGRHGVPMTVYLAAGLLDGKTPFWWDTLARLLLAPPDLPERIELALGETTLSWSRPPGALPPTDPAWRSWTEGGPRERLFLDLWARMRLLDVHARTSALRQLACFVEAGAQDPADRPLDGAEAAQLAAMQNVEIGAHTMTHPSLPCLHPDDAEREIAASREACEAIASRPVESFSYPYGDHEARVVEMVRALGFTSACTTLGSPVPRRGLDRFRLPRIQALDWTGDELARRLARAELS